MITKRLWRRPATIGFIREIEQPLLDHIVRPAGKIFLNIGYPNHGLFTKLQAISL